MNKIENGCCIYCGQIYQIETEGGMTVEDLNRMATEKCDCNDAVMVQRKEKAKNEAEQNITDLFKRDFPEMADLLRAAVGPLEKYEIASITIDTGKKVKGKVSMTSKGNIKVEKTKNLKEILES